MNAPLPIARFTDDEFERLIGKGAVEVLSRVELRDGTLHRLNAQYAPHAWVKRHLARELENAVAAAGLPLDVLTECTVKFGGGFSPLPDVLVWAPSPTQKTIPGADVKLIAEVADTTLADDLGAKRAEYARAGLPEYWVADLGSRSLHRFSGPEGENYARAAIFREGEEIASETLKGVAVTLVFP